ncbi:hypothetical protein HYH03_015360 [Edaphochlamys debaryana]|uniref:Uncharacterized protein n=1 Tax=Edaphochlamys debaryana TaxID=47281 RepID=A0A835XPH1_9CHLO|nr:hypothetical protein HYH03_015360 [Edaphochlamys debaryana]|eukprot:KAG2485916.1 hypothetical protein HYH03_015360 [Edaphochlamys debaryana]
MASEPRKARVTVRLEIDSLVKRRTKERKLQVSLASPLELTATVRRELGQQQWCRFPQLQRIEVTAWRQRLGGGGGGKPLLRPWQPQGGAWPRAEAGEGRGRGRLEMEADVRVTPAAPKELSCTFLGHEDRVAPGSAFRLADHRVRCGCGECAAKQAGGAAPRQANGYWTPANWIQHVAGFRFRDVLPAAAALGRAGEVVPLKPRPRRHLRFLLERPGGGRPQVMTVDEMCAELGYRWGYVKARG